MSDFVHARQIEPEYQDSRWQEDEIWKNLAIINLEKNCYSYNDDFYNQVKSALNEILDEIEEVGEENSWYKTNAELFNDLLPKHNGEEYSENEIQALLQLANEFDDYVEASFSGIPMGMKDEATIVAETMSMIDGREFDTFTIHGYCQGEAATVVYPVGDAPEGYTGEYKEGFADNSFKYDFEELFYNGGTEWVVEVSEDESFSMYLLGDKDKVIKQIADECGVSPDKVLLYSEDNGYELSNDDKLRYGATEIDNVSQGFSKDDVIDLLTNVSDTYTEIELAIIDQSDLSELGTFTKTDNGYTLVAEIPVGNTTATAEFDISTFEEWDVECLRLNDTVTLKMNNETYKLNSPAIDTFLEDNPKEISKGKEEAISK